MLDFIVLALGACLAVLALPNEVFASGWGFLGPFFLAPVFWFALRHRPWVSALGAVVWVLVFTLLSQFWLLSFNPVAFPLVVVFQGLWYAAAFALVSLGFARRPNPWVPALLWTFFEFVRVQGFLAFPYGSVASSLWSAPWAIQSAEFLGTSGLNFLLAWGAAWVALALERRLPWSRLRVDLGVGLSLWSLNLGWGLWTLSQTQTGERWRPALVQHAQDPWTEGTASYETALDALVTLSDRARANEPDAIIWSETAFVPSVDFHSRYRENPRSLGLVRTLEAFLSSQSTPFLVGNGHREKAEGTIHDYNAALAWDGGWSGRYEKNRLVPFTESFPYGDLLPGVRQWLLDSGAHFWEPGRGHSLLRLGTVTVGTPICYEDTFPEASRAFAAQGARALVNLTNDGWARGQAAKVQHLSLAVFRAVETRLPLLRAANDGVTASISSRGEVVDRLAPGGQGVLQAEVVLAEASPSGQGTTLYVLWGDWFPWCCGVMWVSLVFWPRRRFDVDKGPQL